MGTEASKDKEPESIGNKHACCLGKRYFKGIGHPKGKDRKKDVNGRRHKQITQQQIPKVPVPEPYVNRSILSIHKMNAKKYYSAAGSH
jgi:hypothetical protein